MPVIYKYKIKIKSYEKNPTGKGTGRAFSLVSCCCGVTLLLFP
jgi:hypothetical protein